MILWTQLIISPSDYSNPMHLKLNYATKLKGHLIRVNDRHNSLIKQLAQKFGI